MAFCVTVHWASTEPVLQYHSITIHDVLASHRFGEFIERVHVARDVAAREAVQLYHEGHAMKPDDCFMDAGIRSNTHMVLAAGEVASTSTSGGCSALQPHGGAPWPRVLLDAVQAAREAMTVSGCVPELSAAGEGGTYFLRGREVPAAADMGDDTPPAPTRPFVAAFKPRDEEALAPNNPKGRRGAFGSPTLRAGIRSGECYAREVAAYMLDAGGAAGVPPTAIVRGQHAAFYVHDDGHERNASPSLSGSDTDVSPLSHALVGAPMSIGDAALGPPASVEVRLVPFVATSQLPSLSQHTTSVDASPLSMDTAPVSTSSHRVRGKTGSFQAFVSNASVIEEHYSSIPRLDVDEVQMIAAFDMRVLNADRNTDNILVQVQLRDPPAGAASKGLRHRKVTHLKLIPIDHGYILPGDVGVVNMDWCWAEWPQVKLPMTDKVKALIRSMDADADIARLRSVFPRSVLSERCLMVLRLTTAILKRAEASGLTLAHAAAVIARTDFTSHSLMEKWLETAGGMAVMRPLRSTAAHRPRTGLAPAATSLTRTRALDGEASKVESVLEAFRAGMNAMLTPCRPTEATACAHSASRTLARASAAGHGGVSLKLREAPLAHVAAALSSATHLAAALDASGAQVSICLSMLPNVGEGCPNSPKGAAGTGSPAPHACMRLTAHSDASVTAHVSATMDALLASRHAAEVREDSDATLRWSDVFGAHGAVVTCGVAVVAGDFMGAAVSGMVHDTSLSPAMCSDDVKRIIIASLSAAVCVTAAAHSTVTTTLPCMRACEQLMRALQRDAGHEGVTATKSDDMERNSISVVMPTNDCMPPRGSGISPVRSPSCRTSSFGLPSSPSLARVNTTLCPYRTPSFTPTHSYAPASGTLVTLASHAPTDEGAADALVGSLGAAFARSVSDPRACAIASSGLKICMRWEDGGSVGACAPPATPLQQPQPAPMTLTRTYTHMDTHHLRTGVAMRAFMPETAGTPMSAHAAPSAAPVPTVLLGLRRNVSMGDHGDAAASTAAAGGAVGTRAASDFEAHFRSQMDAYFLRLAPASVAVR